MNQRLHGSGERNGTQRRRKVGPIARIVAAAVGE